LRGPELECRRAYALPLVTRIWERPARRDFIGA
jgi:hypothetical protein